MGMQVDDDDDDEIRHVDDQPMRDEEDDEEEEQKEEEEAADDADEAIATKAPLKAQDTDEAADVPARKKAKTTPATPPVVSAQPMTSVFDSDLPPSPLLHSAVASLRRHTRTTTSGGSPSVSLTAAKHRDREQSPVSGKSTSTISRTAGTTTPTAPRPSDDTPSFAAKPTTAVASAVVSPEFTRRSSPRDDSALKRKHSSSVPTATTLFSPTSSDPPSAAKMTTTVATTAAAPIAAGPSRLTMRGSRATTRLLSSADGLPVPEGTSAVTDVTGVTLSMRSSQTSLASYAQQSLSSYPPPPAPQPSPPHTDPVAPRAPTGRTGGRGTATAAALSTTTSPTRGATSPSSLHALGCLPNSAVMVVLPRAAGATTASPTPLRGSRRRGAQAEALASSASSSATAEEADAVPATCHIIITGCGRTQKATLTQQIQALGGTVCSDEAAVAECTHVLAVELKRSEKVFLAILLRKPVVQLSFLEASTSSGRFVSATPFLWTSWQAKHSTLQVEDVEKTTQLSKAIAFWATDAHAGDPTGDMDMDDTGPTDGVAAVNVARPFDGWRVALWADENKEQTFRRVLEVGGAEVTLPNKTSKKFSYRAGHFTHALLEAPLDECATALYKHVKRSGGSAPCVCVRPEYIMDFIALCADVQAADYVVDPQSVSQSSQVRTATRSGK
jgi:hypothetical protein